MDYLRLLMEKPRSSVFCYVSGQLYSFPDTGGVNHDRGKQSRNEIQSKETQKKKCWPEKNI